MLMMMKMIMKLLIIINKNLLDLYIYINYIIIILNRVYILKIL